MTELINAVQGSEIIYRLGWTLVHSLWLGAVVGVAFAVTMVLLRRRSAGLRYLAGCAALVLMVAAPVGTFLGVRAPGPGHEVTPPPVSVAAGRLDVPMDTPPVPMAPSAGPFSESAEPVQRSVAPAPTRVGPLPAAYRRVQEKPAAIEETPWTIRARQAVEPALLWVVLGWAAGVMGLSVWQLAGCMAASRLKRLATQPGEPALVDNLRRLARALRVSRPVRLLESMLVRVPTVVGWLRPVILLPVGLAAGLTPQQVEAILAHELAHIRRCDYLVNLLQTLVETLLFYHPAVWFISRRIRAEREKCCDDVAVSAGAERFSYAESLIHVLRQSAQRPRRLAPALGAAPLQATGKASELRSRIVHLLGAGAAEAPRNWPAVAAVLAGLAITATVLVSVWAGPATPVKTAGKDPNNAATQPATLPAADPNVRKWVKTADTPKDRAGMYAVVERVDGGKGAMDKDLLHHAPPLSAKPAGKSLEEWFTILLFSNIRLNPDDEKFLFFCSRQVNDKDLMWIERIERDGNHFTIHMKRAIWQGVYHANVLYHSVYAVNLGRLPESRYTVEWIVEPLEFTQLDKDGWPADAKAHPRDKPTTLTWGFGYAPATRPTTQPASVPTTGLDSRLRQVKLVVGMKRVEAERLIAEATGVKSKYDLHAMDTSSEVRYSDGTTVLIVRYKPGSPAPTIALPDGGRRSYPPVDGEVLSWEFTGAAQDRTSATRLADGNDAYRGLYTTYKALILKAAQDGNAAEVGRLTDQFNESIGGCLLYALVQKIEPGGKFTVLLTKAFSPDYITPLISYVAGDEVHVTWHPASVVVERILDGDLHMRLDLKPLPPATQSAASLGETDRKILSEAIERWAAGDAWAEGGSKAPRNLARNKLDIAVSAPEAAVTRASVRRMEPDGNREVLVLPLEIANSSAVQVKTSIAHEWHGGEWARSDLYAAAIVPESNQPVFTPLFLAGEKWETTEPTVIEPNQSVRLTARMDWPGTGSVRGRLLVVRPGVYKIRFVLVFEAEGKKQFVESDPVVFDYQPQEPATQPASAPATQPATLPAGDPRRGAVITLEPEKEEYFLGENILVHYHIRNEGKEPFQISVGGDSRTGWAKRAIRFKVEAADAQGRKALDPYPNPPNMGGRGGDVNVAPGGEWWEDVPLMRYRELAARGSYTIRVWHDLGWRDANGTYFSPEADGSDIPAGRMAPVVAATIRVRMPDEKQARQLVRDMLSAPADAGRTWGERGKAHPDFELLRYPVYLPIMVELAEKGDARGLDAIAAMAFPEATGALLDLMQHKDKAIAARALEVLLWRVPALWPSSNPTRHSYLAERCWRDDLKARTSQIGWDLLDGKDRDGRIRGGQIRGGQIIQSLGRKVDLPALIKVMDRLLVAYKADPTEQNAYPRPMTVSWALEMAARKLVERGARPPASAGTPGEAVAFLAALADPNAGFRPPGWQGVATGLLKHDIPFIRALALECMPLPLSDAAADAVAACIRDKFEPVRRAACDLAGKSKLERFRAPLTEVLQSAKNEWIVRGSFSAAAACGADMDRLLEICVGRLERYSNARNMVLVGLMIDGAIQHEGGYGAQSHDDWQPFLGDVQKAWGDFLQANRDALRAGRKFLIGQPPITREMFPPKFAFSRAGLPPWPDWSAAPLTPASSPATQPATQAVQTQPVVPVGGGSEGPPLAVLDGGESGGDR